MGTRKIYYDKVTGDVIYSASYNIAKDVDFNHDYNVLVSLNSRTKESIGLLVLNGGEYEQDFAECADFRINPETKELEFSYPDPNAPELEQPYQAPLSEQIASNTDYLLDVDFRLMLIELGM